MPKPLNVRSIAVIFTVKDLRQTKDFYRAVLGIELEVVEGYSSFKLPDGTELMFLEGEASRGASPQIVFGLEDGNIDGVAEGLAKQGVQLVTPVTEAPGGWAFEFRDPDGHPLAFYQDGKQPRRLPR